MLGLSEMASRIVQSTIRTMSVECEKVGGVNLAQGVCDTAVPEVVRKAAEDAKQNCPVSKALASVPEITLESQFDG